MCDRLADHSGAVHWERHADNTVACWGGEQCVYCGDRAYEPGFGCHQCGMAAPGDECCAAPSIRTHGPMSGRDPESAADRAQRKAKDTLEYLGASEADLAELAGDGNSADDEPPVDEHDISETESAAAKADALARWGEIPPSLQSVTDRGGRFGMPQEREPKCPEDDGEVMPDDSRPSPMGPEPALVTPPRPGPGDHAPSTGGDERREGPGREIPVHEATIHPDPRLDRWPVTIAEEPTGESTPDCFSCSHDRHAECTGLPCTCPHYGGGFLDELAARQSGTIPDLVVPEAASGVRNLPESPLGHDQHHHGTTLTRATDAVDGPEKRHGRHARARRRKANQ